jgi:hypothetical protein
MSKYWVWFFLFSLISCGEKSVKDKYGYTIFYFVYQKNGLIRRNNGVLDKEVIKNVKLILTKLGHPYKIINGQLYVKPPKIYGDEEPLGTYMWLISSEVNSLER